VRGAEWSAPNGQHNSHGKRHISKDKKIAGAKVFLAVALALLLASSMVTANANAEQKNQTKLTLENVPQIAYAGDTITFTGSLVRTSNGEGIAKAPVMIKNENVVTGSDVIAAGSTDDDGRFNIQWIADVEKKATFRVYASYMGRADYSASVSEKYTIEVERLDLIVHTNKESFKNDETLVVYGSGRPKDVLSIFVTSSAYSVMYATKIIVDESGKFNATLLTWSSKNDSGTYVVYVRSTTDMISEQRLIIFFFKQIIELPQGIETVLTLDPPLSNATYNDDLVFTGKLETKTGLPIKEAMIMVKYSDDKDGILSQWITRDDGRFFINWKALQLDPDNSLNVYASFDGGNGFLSSGSDQYEIKFKPRKLTLELNKVSFVSNEILVVSGTAPPKEKVNIKLIDPAGNAVVAKSVLVYPGEAFEKEMMLWTRPSYVFPEGDYTVMAETENSPILTASRILRFAEPRPLSEYKIVGSVLHEDPDGKRLPIEGAKVKLLSPYGEFESYTDASGKYEFHDLHSIVENMKKVFSLTVELDNKYFRLIDGSNSKMISKKIASVKFDGGLHDIELEPVVFSGKSEAAAGRIFSMQNDVVRFYTEVIGVHPEKIDIEIFSSATSKGKYGYETHESAPKIWVGKGTSSPRNPYTWDTLAHEYTHYMQDLYASVGHYQSMNHGGFDNPTTEDSMVEGFADFMAAVIAQHYSTERAGKFLQYSLETNYKVNSPKYLSEEMAVAGVFWDIYDSGQDDDEISLDIKDIWKIMSDEYSFPSYHEDSGVGAETRNVYYLKDLHYVLIQGQGFMWVSTDYVEDLFNNHAIVDGFTDPERPGRI
jgi:hypothetical protein